jgi:hypothetical protein
MTAELARLIDAQGHEVTAEITRSGLLVILSRTPDEGLSGGHPALNAENARELGLALIAFADREVPG